MSVTEVLAPGELSLNELAAEANREHGLVVRAGESIVEHAIRAGDALRAARERVPSGQWYGWIEDNLVLHRQDGDGALEGETLKSTATLYMRISRYQSEIRTHGFKSIHQARHHLMAVAAPTQNPGVTRAPEWMIRQAQKMHADGVPILDIAEDLGVGRTTARRWVDHKFAEEHRRRNKEERARKRAAIRALREKEREQAIKRAVRKAGAATAEAWQMAERMQDVLAQAQRETEDRDAKRALSEAGVHYRKMRDEIVRALGVA